MCLIQIFEGSPAVIRQRGLSSSFPRHGSTVLEATLDYAGDNNMCSCENIYVGDYPISCGELVLLLKYWMSFRDTPELNNEYTETLNNRIVSATKCISIFSERTFVTTGKGNLRSTRVAVKEGDRGFVVLGCSYPATETMEPLRMWAAWLPRSLYKIVAIPSHQGLPIHSRL